MLDLQPAAPRPRTSTQTFGLALAGGGPLGAFYEVGTLHAISESFEGIDLTNLDMYVGVSSGAMIAAGLANGIDTTDMGVVFIHNASVEYPVRPGLFLRPAFREFLGRIGSVPGLAADILTQYLRDPGKDWAEAIDPLGRLLPTGLCDNRPFEQFLAQLFSGHGRTNDFRKLRRSLYIVATELNSGYSVRFGEPGFEHVPISRAIQASTALPGPVPAGPDRRSHVRRRRADAHHECLAAARRGRRLRHLHQSAGRVRRVERSAGQQRRAQGPGPDPRRTADRAQPDVPRADPVAHAGRHAHLQAELPEHRRAAVRAGPRRRRAVLQERLPLRRPQAARRARLPAHAARPARECDPPCAASSPAMGSACASTCSRTRRGRSTARCVRGSGASSPSLASCTGRSTGSRKRWPRAADA